MNWNDIAKDYSKEVYSITQWKEKRSRIIDRLSDGLHILIIGCGSEVYLQKEILEKYPNSTIVLSDYFEEMLNVSRDKFNHPNLAFAQEDMISIAYSEEFDVVITTNSVLMPTIADNNRVFENLFKSLKIGGMLIGYFPSYDSVLNSLSQDDSLSKFFLIDNKEQALFDGVDGSTQSFHSMESLKKNLSTYSHSIDKVSCSESEEEFSHFKDLYGSLLSDNLIRQVFEYFVVAIKK